MNKKQQQAENILKHGFNLQNLYPESKRMGPVTLCKALHRIEAEAHRYAEQGCNGPEMTEAEQDKKEKSIVRRVNAILGPGPDIFLNGDPRGYALKIETEAANGLNIYKDWGGFGIICPEF